MSPLPASRIVAYLRGELSGAERAELEAALDRDPQSLAVVALLTHEGRASEPDAGRPEDPAE